MLLSMELKVVLRMELSEFLKRASKRERAELAEVCNNSVSYLYQLAGKHRFASALLAIKIEIVSGRIAKKSDGRLDLVPRESLVRYPEIFMDINKIISEVF
jgi:hypothetical protein